MSDAPLVVAFDVFGTVVDWHGSIRREVEAMAPGVDGDAFALAWRAGYQPAMARVRRGEIAWTTLDVLHRGILDAILPAFGLQAMDEASRRHLNAAWHRLDPWPDAVPALHRLKARFTICTLSNGNTGLLANMAKRAGLPWDAILSAELFRHYKPDPQAYLGVASTFDVPPERVMLVATHKDDLDAAAACGLQTAHVARPEEFGPSVRKDVSPEPRFTLNAADFHDLADQLGCPR